MLEAALRLISERGVRGASLRALAAELGISQPSLYHYFPSKRAMVTAIVEHSAQNMVATGLALAPPKTPADLPRFVRDTTLLLYESESHPRFVRFLFAVAIESEENRDIIARVFAERLDPSFDMLVRWLTDDPATHAELAQLTRMIVYSLGFMLLEDRALLARPKPTQRTLDYAEWIVAASDHILEARVKTAATAGVAAQANSELVARARNSKRGARTARKPR